MLQGTHLAVQLAQAALVVAVHPALDLQRVGDAAELSRHNASTPRSASSSSVTFCWRRVRAWPSLAVCSSLKAFSNLEHIRLFAARLLQAPLSWLVQHGVHWHMMRMWPALAFCSTLMPSHMAAGMMKLSSPWANAFEKDDMLCCTAAIVEKRRSRESGSVTCTSPS